MKFLLDMGLARSTVDVLDRFADQLESGALVSVSEQAIRVRLLPIDDAGS